MRLTSKSIDYTVPTVNDFPTTDLVDGQVVVVSSDGGRNGTFFYDSTKSTVNDGGVTFNGWVRDYSGAVNVAWFGDTTLEQTFKNASLVSTSCFIDAGTYTLDANTISFTGILFHSLGAVTINTNTTLKVFDLSSLDPLNINASTLDSLDSTSFATSAQGALADAALPATSKAVDSDLLDGLNSTVFSQIASTEDITGSKTFSNVALNITAIPTADPLVVGQLWNNVGVLTVSAG